MSAAILFKLFIAVVLILIGISLLSGLFFLVKDDSDTESRRLLTSLSFRVALSIILFISLIVGYNLGWIQPHGLGQ